MYSLKCAYNCAVRVM